MSEQSKTLTVVYTSGTSEAFSYTGPFWTWREFLCVRREGDDHITYVPLARIEHMEAGTTV